MAKSNYETASPGGKPMTCTPKNTPMHKLLAYGKHPKVSVSRPKTPA